MIIWKDGDKEELYYSEIHAHWESTKDPQVKFHVPSYSKKSKIASSSPKSKKSMLPSSSKSKKSTLLSSSTKLKIPSSSL